MPNPVHAKHGNQTAISKKLAEITVPRLWLSDCAAVSTSLVTRERVSLENDGQISKRQRLTFSAIAVRKRFENVGYSLKNIGLCIVENGTSFTYKIAKSFGDTSTQLPNRFL